MREMLVTQSYMKEISRTNRENRVLLIGIDSIMAFMGKEEEVRAIPIGLSGKFGNK